MKPLPAVSGRLASVVDAVFRGNVSQAADAAQVPTPTLHRIVNGQIASPRIATLRSIADNLGVSVAWLIGERSNEQEFGEASPWRGLILAYNKRRQSEQRSALRGLRPRTAKGKRIVAAYENLSWGLEPPIPALPDIADGIDHDRFITQMLREFGDIQAQLVDRALERVRELEID